MKKNKLMCAIIAAISFSQLKASDNQIFESDFLQKASISSSVIESEYANLGFFQKYKKVFEETKEETDFCAALCYYIKAIQEQIALLQSTTDSKNFSKIKEAKKQVSIDLAQVTEGMLTQKEIEEYLN